MKNREIITALGITAALTVSACGAEAVPEETAKETGSVSPEESTQPVSVSETVKETEAEESSAFGTLSVTETSTESSSVSEGSSVDPGFEIEPMDPTIMYGKQTANVRKGPSTDYEIVKQIGKNEEVTVIGKTKADNGKIWYALKTDDGSPELVSSSLLSSEKLTAAAPGSGAGGSSASVNPAAAAKPQTPADCYIDCEEGDGDSSYCEGDCGICTDGSPYCNGFCQFDDDLPVDCQCFDCFTDCCSIIAE